MASTDTSQLIQLLSSLSHDLPPLFFFSLYFTSLHFILIALKNSRILQLTHLKCTIQCVCACVCVYYNHSCATTTAVNFRTFSLLQKETLCPLKMSPNRHPNLSAPGNR